MEAAAAAGSTEWVQMQLQWRLGERSSRTRITVGQAKGHNTAAALGRPMKIISTATTLVSTKLTVEAQASMTRPTWAMAVMAVWLMPKEC